MNILVLNAGSSSLKFNLFDSEQLLAKGEVERIGGMGDAVASVFQQIGDVRNLRFVIWTLHESRAPL